jgi:hypothetical protein
MAYAAPQPVPGAAAAAYAPAHQLLTLPALKTILKKHINRVSAAVTPLTQISDLYELEGAPVSELLLLVPGYMQHLQQRVNSNGQDRLAVSSASGYIKRLLLLSNRPPSPEASLQAVLTAFQLQQVWEALELGVQEFEGLLQQQQPPPAATAAGAVAGRQPRTPAKRKRLQSYADQTRLGCLAASQDQDQNQGQNQGQNQILPRETAIANCRSGPELTVR